MSARDWIARKRDGGALRPDEIRSLVAGAVAGTIPDYQLSAFLMAVFLRGLSEEETATLTDAMMRSGTVREPRDGDRRLVDKHSTGGVGDKVSLILAPLAAACGLRVPMFSGRGLGHTGGTLDKLESIPGFSTRIEPARFDRLLDEVGAVIAGQSREFVPADGILYALRDVTATVESIPLICASIMSKKLAEGISGLVLDVKVGRGAFMKEMADARELARAMVATGRRMNRETVAWITRMDQPLGRSVGNAVEVAEAIDALRGDGPADLMEVVRVLTAEMLLVGGVAETSPDAYGRIEQAIADGSALERFGRMIAGQGGDPQVIDEPGRLPASEHTREIRLRDVAGTATNGDRIASVDAMKVARAAGALGAGRTRKEDAIDPSVGITGIVKAGERVHSDTPLCVLHYADPERLEEAVKILHGAFETSPAAVEPAPQLIERIAG